MINNRQSGRRRGRGGSSQRSSGGGSSGQRDSGNRIDSRARGNAAQLLEKYKNMARDAQMQGDRVNTEYYLQFADHYFRVLSDGRSRTDDQRPQAQNGFDGDDDYYGDEGEPVRAGEQTQGREDEGRGDGNRNDGRNDGNRSDTRNDGNRNDGQRRDYQPRDDRGRDGQQRDYQSRDSQSRDHQPRETQQRDYQPRDTQNRDSSRDDGRRDQAPRETQRETQREDHRRDSGNQQPTSNGHAYRNGGGDQPVSAAPEAAKPERKPSSRSRKPSVAVEEDAPMFDANLLPPSLGISVAPTDPDAEVKPKKRRGRPPASAATEAN